MALTPEDVVNKRFNPTKFREGYDQDEVDDFLDEVVVELRRLNQENEELRQRLAGADARISELQRAASQAPAASAMPAPAPVPAAAPVAPAPEFAAQDSGSMDQSNTNNLLQLARRLHEEHVREGMEKRDQLIAEGHATAARIVSDAETQQRASLAALEAERAGLEHRVEELRIFESEYREKLRGYIEGQLRELESAGPISAPSMPAPQPVSASAAPTFDAQSASNAPAYAAPSYQVPSYEPPAYQSAAPGAPSGYAVPAQEAPVAEPTSLQDYPAPTYGDFAHAPQAASPSAPPAYAAFPAPHVAAEQHPGDQQPSQQPDYPAYSQRATEFPGFGGN